MAFKLGTQEALDKPITRKVLLPICNEAGTVVNHQITMLYHRMTVQQIGEILERHSAEAEILDGLSGAAASAAVIDLHTNHVLRLAAGWREVQGEDGSDAAFTFDNVRQLLNSVPRAYHQIKDGFDRANRGGAALGN